VNFVFVSAIVFTRIQQKPQQNLQQSTTNLNHQMTELMQAIQSLFAEGVAVQPAAATTTNL
jgi:ABC-type transport system involved in cytochrome bd biosynthesis fused ATPase/permease subunit